MTQEMTTSYSSIERMLNKALHEIEIQKQIIANQEQIIKNDKGIVEVLNKMVDVYRRMNRRYRDILFEEEKYHDTK